MFYFLIFFCYKARLLNISPTLIFVYTLLLYKACPKDVNNNYIYIINYVEFKKTNIVIN